MEQEKIVEAFQQGFDAQYEELVRLFAQHKEDNPKMKWEALWSGFINVQLATSRSELKGHWDILGPDQKNEWLVNTFVNRIISNYDEAKADFEDHVDAAYYSLLNGFSQAKSKNEEISNQLLPDERRKSYFKHEEFFAWDETNAAKHLGKLEAIDTYIKEKNNDAKPLTGPKSGFVNVSIVIPEKKRDGHQHNFTALGRKETVWLFKELQEQNVVLKDRKDLTNVNLAKALRVLTQYSSDNIETDLSSRLSLDEKSKNEIRQILTNIIKKLD